MKILKPSEVADANIIILSDVIEQNKILKRCLEDMETRIQSLTEQLEFYKRMAEGAVQ